MYGIHLYCSEAVSRVMQGLFHDHVKRQLLWKCWDVFFNYVKGSYDATMTVIRYGLQLWILRLYALHVPHIDTQTRKLAELFLIWTSHIIVTLLYRHRTHSLNPIQYHTHQPTQIYYTHNILSQFTNICGIDSQAVKGIKHIQWGKKTKSE